MADGEANAQQSRAHILAPVAMNLLLEVEIGMKAWRYHLFVNDFNGPHCDQIVFDGRRAINAIANLVDDQLYEALEQLKLINDFRIDRNRPTTTLYLPRPQGCI